MADKVQGGTPRGFESLCGTCRNAQADTRPHLVYEAYASLLRKAAEWDEKDWECANRFERHAVNAVLDLKAEREPYTLLIHQTVRCPSAAQRCTCPAHQTIKLELEKELAALSRTESAKEQK